jgi:hypothetical protein
MRVPRETGDRKPRGSNPAAPTTKIREGFSHREADAEKPCLFADRAANSYALSARAPTLV